MLGTATFLFCASVILAFSLKTTVDELHTLINYVDVELLAGQQAANSEIRSYLSPLANYTRDASGFFIGNLSEAAKPYWNEIDTLNKQAAADGQNISTCIDLGNSQIYSLNNTILNPISIKINFYKNKGNRIISYSLNNVNVVIDELNDLKIKISNCSDDNCATELAIEVTSLFDRGLEVFEEAMEVVDNYVIHDLRNYLTAAIAFDVDQYAENYNTYLANIKNCIKNL